MWYIYRIFFYVSGNPGYLCTRPTLSNVLPSPTTMIQQPKSLLSNQSLETPAPAPTPSPLLPLPSSSTPIGNSVSPIAANGDGDTRPVFFFDIDNCLYPRSYKIHDMMKDLIHKYFVNHLGMFFSSFFLFYFFYDTSHILPPPACQSIHAHLTRPHKTCRNQ